MIHTEKRGPFPVLKASLPKVPNAEFVNEDELCMTCHETHVKLFQEKNVHRQFKCEECHGPASEHVASRGQEVGKILNVKRLKPAERSEICLRCHEKELVPHARGAVADLAPCPQGRFLLGLPPRPPRCPQGNSGGHASSGNITASAGQAGTERHGPEVGSARPPRGFDHDSRAVAEASNALTAQAKAKRNRPCGGRRRAWKRPRPTSVIAATRAHSE